MDDFKSAEPAQRLAPRCFFVPDEPADFRVLDRFPEFVQLRLAALRKQFYSSVRQIAHRSSQIKPMGNVFDRIAKPDALHTTRVNNLQAPTIHIPHSLLRVAACDKAINAATGATIFLGLFLLSPPFGFEQAACRAGRGLSRGSWRGIGSPRDCLR